MDNLIAKDRFKQLAEMWFLREPAFFAVYCINDLTENPYMNCAIRCGQGRIEYNADYIKTLTDNQLDELMKAEMIRVFLKHPYSRRPINCPNEKMIAASDMTLYGHYNFNEYRFVNPADFDLEPGNFYEWYLMRMNDERLDDSGDDSNDGDGNNDKSDSKSGFNTDVPGSLSERAALWDEDDEQCDKINKLIEQINSTNSWGSIPGNLTEKIVASSKAKIDYRKTLSGFRASILSSKRHLTRMRPNRRFEFQQMGSKYDLETRLLIAVDTSLSVTHTELANFFGVMRRMFRYGVSKIDVIQFDCQLQTPQPISLKDAKHLKISEVKGRGGTDFQVAFDYLQNHNVYDGMIIFTDGYAQQPKIDFFTRTKFVWVLTDEKSYDENKEWMRKIGRVCYINVK